MGLLNTTRGMYNYEKASEGILSLSGLKLGTVSEVQLRFM